MTASASALADAGAEDDAALLRELAINNPRKAQGTEQLKVWPTNANRTAFTAGKPPRPHAPRVLFGRARGARSGSRSALR